MSPRRRIFLTLQLKALVLSSKIVETEQQFEDIYAEAVNALGAHAQRGVSIRAFRATMFQLLCQQK